MISLGEFVDRSFSYFFMPSVFSKLSTMKKKSKTIPFFVCSGKFSRAVLLLKLGIGFAGEVGKLPNLIGHPKGRSQDFEIFHHKLVYRMAWSSGRSCKLLVDSVASPTASLLVFVAHDQLLESYLMGPSWWVGKS